MNLKLNQDVRVEGFYRLRKYKGTSGELVYDSGDIKNLITDQGLTRWTANAFAAYCFVGTGTATPAYTDTQMGVFLAFSASVQAISPVQLNYPTTDWCSRSTTWRFATGVAAGNLTEVGVGYSTSGSPTSSTNRVSSRALILDSGGLPITLTVLSDETLDVTYTMKMYVPTAAADQSYNVTISGTSYAIVARVASCGNWTLSPTDLLTGNAAILTYSSSSVLGAVTGRPTSSSGSNGSLTVTCTAASGVITKTLAASCALAQGNATGGIKCLVALINGTGNTNISETQFSFTPVLPKDGTKVLTMTFTQTLTRL